MTRTATTSVFQTWADTDAREPVFEEPRNRGWGWEFETRERLADASSGQRQIYADRAGPCRPVKFIPSLSTAFSDQAREPFQIQYQSPYSAAIAFGSFDTFFLLLLMFKIKTEEG
jgi:hypothetical protein